jgi:hypothetical protein
MCGTGPYDMDITELQNYKSNVYELRVFISGEMDVYVVLAIKTYT